MKKILCFVLCVAFCFTSVGCNKYFEPEVRPMTTEEIFEFAKTYGNIHSSEYTRFTTYEHQFTPFVNFLKSIPELESDICHPATADDNIPRLLCSSPWKIYWRDADDVINVWHKYVDTDSTISTQANEYYSSEENRFYFNDNLFGCNYELRDGYIKGDTATIYCKYSEINFKYSDGKWKLYSYYKTNNNKATMCDRMERLCGEELENIRQQIKLTSSELFDGYKDNNLYIIYGEHRMHYIKYENGTYTEVAESQLSWRRENTPEENIYVAEGKLNAIQYTVKLDCIPTDETKSAKYNEAVSAYNDFLSSKAEGVLEFVNDDNEQSSLYPSYIKDLNKDGIPEMISYVEPMWPYFVFTYRNGEVVELPGPFSNGQHGGCGLLENGMYRSQHHTTGWINTFVTYNRNGSQTIERFSEYSTYGYEKYTVTADGTETAKYSIEFEKDDEGKQKFDALYAPYKEALEHWDYSGKTYSPFVPDLTLNYSPYVMQQIERIYK